MYRLDTERLILRSPQTEDLRPWTSFFLSERAKPLGGGPQHSALVAWRAFASIAGHWTLNGCGPFVCLTKAGDKAVGLSGPWFPESWPERELSWSLWSEEAEGLGLAYEAAARVRQHVFDDLRWETAVSYIAPDNARSIALAERLGCHCDVDAKTPDGDATLVFRHPAGSLD
ncbi:MAG: GNAT family N-acetyltransferase [Pseudomonadota bacterium]